MYYICANCKNKKKFNYWVNKYGNFVFLQLIVQELRKMKVVDLVKNMGKAMRMSESMVSPRFCHLSHRLGRQVGAIVLCATLAILISSCSDKNDQTNDREPQASDTLYTVNAAMDIYAYEPERALAIVDSALLLGNVEYNHAQLLRAKIFSQSLVENQLDSAQEILLGLLSSSYTENKNIREEVFDLLLNIAYKRQQLELQLHWGALKVECCRELGRETEALRTEADLALALAQLGEEERGLAKLNSIIAKLDGHRNIDKMDACVIALKRKILTLKQMGKDEEAIPVAQHIIEILNDYREHYTEYTNDSYRLEQTEEVTMSYCEFYIAQANSIIANSYAMLGKTDSARHYLELFEQSSYSHTYAGRKYIVSTYCLLGDYDKMDEIYDEMVQKMGTDTLNNEYADMLHNRADEAKAHGNYQLANAYLQRYEYVKQQLNERLLKSRAYEYATRYQLQEEQMKAENEQRRAKTNMYMSIVGYSLLLLAIGVIILLGTLYSKIRRKNRILAEHISESLHYKNEFQKLESEAEMEAASVLPVNSAFARKAEVAADSKSDTYNSEIKSLEGLSDEQLFKFLSETIRRERLFTNPILGRQMLMDRFNLSERRIGAAFSRGSEHNSLPDFVRELRLEYACQLLVEHDDMTISDVSAASGFSSLAVFSREFKREFDLTPTFYRQQINEKSL